ncbi:uncharacterized protein BO95DRAFT_436528 [Aspergillus brunneoviolaceus CBS 621.78]|uniref:Uncharacterized protein n=1 Tax=Aspergillus brunneoviolaceus CBS 621.78 TaxID=1450534 RepID=A0ACD1FUM1_9EURO|nr:hypothetical protein BO95DRAFT_436528 [Aspergillus brunneoviolaceus CBS 621.78]RAH40620.1 hypothetical protein BO95DRAFT_436528 [Aspergillus brunneoviolaceus CBS 621.78]
MFQIETRAPSAAQPRAVLTDRNEVINQAIGRSAGISERPQVSPTRDHGKSEPMHVPYDSSYPEDQENWDWGFMIPSKPRPRSRYAELFRPDWMKRDVNEAQVSKSIVEDVANDEEEFFDWSSSPPRPGRREAEEGLEIENIESELLDTDEFPLRRPNESHEKYVYRVLNLELDDVEA